MQSICPRSFLGKYLFLIIQGINLMYSPQEPVTVALDLPSKSLATQSVGTKQQLGLSQPCQPNRGAGWILAGLASSIWCVWLIMTFDGRIRFHFSISFFLFLTRGSIPGRSLQAESVLFSRHIQIRHTEQRDLRCAKHDSLSKNKQMMDYSKMLQTYL